MAVYNLFSKRQKALRGEVSDVYQYDELPEKLRVQICHVFRDFISLGKFTNIYIDYKDIVLTIFVCTSKILCREYGEVQLVSGNFEGNEEEIIFNFIVTENDIEKCLDAIELICRDLTSFFENENFRYITANIRQPFNDLINELNQRFKENSVGYQFINGQIIRVDSEFMHQEAVKPALNLLSDKDYRGSNSEFLSAFEHYKNGKYAETLNDCLKSLESTMKIICTKHQWSFDKNDASKSL